MYNENSSDSSSVYTNESVDVKSSMGNLKAPMRMIAVFGLIILVVSLYIVTKSKKVEQQAPVIEATYLEGAFGKFPGYPGATKVSEMDKGDEVKKGHEITYQAEATPGQVVQWYLDEASKNDLDWLIMKKPDDMKSSVLTLIGEFLEKEFHMTVTANGTSSTILVDFPAQ
jgi:hypothetical protein